MLSECPSLHCWGRSCCPRVFPCPGPSGCTSCLLQLHWWVWGSDTVQWCCVQLRYSSLPFCSFPTLALLQLLSLGILQRREGSSFPQTAFCVREIKHEVILVLYVHRGLYSNLCLMEGNMKSNICGNTKNHWTVHFKINFLGGHTTWLSSPTRDQTRASSSESAES